MVDSWTQFPIIKWLLIISGFFICSLMHIPSNKRNCSDNIFHLQTILKSTRARAHTHKLLLFCIEFLLTWTWVSSMFSAHKFCRILCQHSYLICYSAKDFVLNFYFGRVIMGKRKQVNPVNMYHRYGIEATASCHLLEPWHIYKSSQSFNGPVLHLCGPLLMQTACTSLCEFPFFSPLSSVIVCCLYQSSSYIAHLHTVQDVYFSQL